MDTACCRTCDGHVGMRHSRCHGGAKNHRVRYPNFISGYTGKIPINLRWTGQDDPCETRDFRSTCKEPVNNFYVVHPPQYLPDGKLELAKVRSILPCPLVQTIAHQVNHPRASICHHEHPIQRQPSGFERVSKRAVRGGGMCCIPCGCGPMLFDYRLMPL